MKRQKSLGYYAAYALCCLLACFVWTNNAHAKVRNLNYSGTAIGKGDPMGGVGEREFDKLECDGYVWITTDAEGNTQVYINDNQFSKEAEDLVVLSELQNNGTENAANAKWEEFELQIEAIDQNHSINVKMDGGYIGIINMGNNKPSYQNNLDIIGGAALYRILFTGTPSGSCIANISNCFLQGGSIKSSAPSKLTINIGKGVRYGSMSAAFSEFYDARNRGAKLNAPLQMNDDGVYEIYDLNDYYWFQQFVNNDGKKDINVKLVNDIESNMKTFIGTANTPYCGTFDGNGHTITVSYSQCEEQTGAVFGHTGEGCKVYNLTVKGSMRGTNHFYGGLIGRANGTTEIRNCNVQVNISSSYNGDNTHGGLISICVGTLTVHNTLFAGSIVNPSGTNCGGMVGWLGDGQTARFYDCAVSATFNLSSTNGSATFCRTGGTAICTDCYYTNLLGRNDGATKISADEVTDGNLCYKLNGKSSSNTTWRQNLGLNGDATPVLDPSHKEVRSRNVASAGNNAFYNEMNTTNGWYVINNKEDYYTLAHIVNSKAVPGPYYIILDADIDLGNQSVAIGTVDAPFSGRFEGNGHSVTLNINNDLKYQGIIGCCDGQTLINNVKMKGSVKCNQYAGLVGGCIGGYLYVYYSTNYADVTTTSTSNGNAAGIVGVVMDGCQQLYIESCLNVGNINGVEAGGISGWCHNGFVYNCLNVGNVTGTNSNPFARGTSYPYVKNCYYIDTSSYPGVVPIGLTPASVEILKSGRIAYQLNEGREQPVWFQTLGEDAYPILADPSHGTVYYGYTDCTASEQIYSNEQLHTEPGHTFTVANSTCIHCDTANPDYMTSVNGWYEIGTAKQLEWFMAYVNEADPSAKAKLTADIEANDIVWSPIGTIDRPFTGTFDGQGFTINGLKYTDYRGECSGMFGKTGPTALIKHLTLKDCKFGNNNKYVGSFCGWNEGTLLNCLNQNTTVSGMNAGGICGRNSGTISNCLSTGKVSRY